MFSPAHAALVLVDVQQAFADPAFGARNNPECEPDLLVTKEVNCPKHTRVVGG
jgi:nicotinamidase-related amidase